MAANEYTEAELRRQELDQQDPRFLEWLSRMDTELDKFFELDVPDMPSDPFTEEGLRRAEAAAIRLFHHRTPEDGPFAYRRERFERFLGEVFVRNVEGKWMWIDVTGKDHAPVVYEPAVPLYLEVGKQVRRALSRTTGDRWAFVFGHSMNNYKAWEAAGRMPSKEWLDYQAQQALARFS